MLKKIIIATIFIFYASLIIAKEKENKLIKKTKIGSYTIHYYYGDQPNSRIAMYSPHLKSIDFLVESALRRAIEDLFDVRIPNKKMNLVGKYLVFFNVKDGKDGVIMLLKDIDGTISSAYIFLK